MSINRINLESANAANGKADVTNVTVGNKNIKELENNTKVTSGDLRLLKDEIEEANHKLRISNRHCQFSCVDGTNRIAIKIIDNDTDQVLKEIPSEETVEMIKKLKEMTGLLIDERG